MSHGLLALLFAVTALELFVRSTDLPALDRLQGRATLAYASNGRILAGFQSRDDKWRFTVDPADVDPRYVDMLVAYEDRNFWSHRGVDYLAAARAAYQALRYGRIVSGASTLTMQLVRLLEPQPRTLEAKILEAARALKLEREWSKSKILQAYLTVAPFGGNIEGVRAASLVYFGKEPEKLSTGEAALLIGLTQSPENRRPDRHPDAAFAALGRVVDSLAARKFLSPDQAAAARADPPEVLTAGFPFHGVHLARRFGSGTEHVHTLLDWSVQLNAEEVARKALRRWDKAVNIAIVVIRNRDGAVVGYVGSGAPTSESRHGFIDLARSVRSPGSTLKPFIYAMAFESVIVHPDTLVADQPVDIAGYRPINADGRYSGDISIRQALIRSKNTVPVLLMDEIGPHQFLSRFRSVGAPLHIGVSDSEAGLAIALGGLGVSLEQLTWFYSALANGGKLSRLRHVTSDIRASLGQLFVPNAARAVADILADVPPPVGRARLTAADGTRRVAYKTGTSYGFRDAWSIGFDNLHTVGVWIGRPDGGPHLGAYGSSAAAPVLMDIFERLPVPASGIASGPAHLGVLASPRELPIRLKRFGPAPSSSPAGPKITFPRDGSQIVSQRDDLTNALPVRVSGGTAPYRWTIQGETGGPENSPSHWISIEGRGQIELSVSDADGRSDRISFWYE